METFARIIREGGARRHQPKQSWRAVLMPFCGIGTVAGLQHDNRIPETFLGGFIACGFYDKLGLHAHVEHPYTVIANKLGTPITPDLLLLMAWIGAKRPMSPCMPIRNRWQWWS